jgi:enoyl-CoA hydratase/carnithine racemase
MSVLVKNLGNGVKNIIINDKKTYNSLSFATLKSLLNTFKKLDKDNGTKVIILEGAGKGFSAGHNLKEVKNLKKDPNILNYSIFVLN